MVGCLAGCVTLSSGVIYARPKLSARALLRVCTRESTERQRHAAGAPNFLWAIGRYNVLLERESYRFGRSTEGALTGQQHSRRGINIVGFVCVCSLTASAYHLLSAGGTRTLDRQFTRLASMLQIRRL